MHDHEGGIDLPVLNPAFLVTPTRSHSNELRCSFRDDALLRTDQFSRCRSVVPLLAARSAPTCYVRKTPTAERSCSAWSCREPAAAAASSTSAAFCCVTSSICAIA